MPAPYDIPPVLAEAFVCLRASRPCHVLVDLIQVVQGVSVRVWHALLLHADAVVCVSVPHGGRGAGT